MQVHRTTSQEASPNGHQKPESAAPPDAIAALATLQAAHLEELKAAYERIAKLEADLHECREYLEDRASVFDDGHGGVSPNRAMQLVSMIDETLNGPGAF